MSGVGCAGVEHPFYKFVQNHITYVDLHLVYVVDARMYIPRRLSLGATLWLKRS